MELLTLLIELDTEDFFSTHLSILFWPRKEPMNRRTFKEKGSENLIARYVDESKQWETNKWNPIMKSSFSGLFRCKLKTPRFVETFIIGHFILRALKLNVLKSWKVYSWTS